MSQPRANYKTTAGTVLPLLNLKGKEYLQVPHRLVWFREERPDWQIETTLIKVDGDSCLARAVIRDPQGNVMASAHKFEDPKGFPDYIEKAETGAVGRALLMIGYGTAFCADELDEGNRLADSPVDPVGMTRPDSPVGAKPQTTLVNNALAKVSQTGAVDPRLFTIDFGRKYNGKAIGSISTPELDGYISWLKDSAKQAGTPISTQVQKLIEAVGHLKKMRGDK